MVFNLIVNNFNCLRASQPTERVGFEPTVPFGTLDFKSSAFDHSATSPTCRLAAFRYRLNLSDLNLKSGR